MLRCAYKTGVLARLSARLGAYLSGASEPFIKAIGRFAEAIGVAFQIQDGNQQKNYSCSTLLDILNIEGEEFAKKIDVVGEDIHEGKRSLMVLHCLATATPEVAARLLEILNLRTNDVALIQEAIGIIKSTDSITHARGVAKEIVEKAWNDIESLLPENEAKTKLKVFADYLINRQI